MSLLLFSTEPYNILVSRLLRGTYGASHLAILDFALLVGMASGGKLPDLYFPLPFSFFPPRGKLTSSGKLLVKPGRGLVRMSSEQPPVWCSFCCEWHGIVTLSLGIVAFFWRWIFLVIFVMRVKKLCLGGDVEFNVLFRVDRAFHSMEMTVMLQNKLLLQWTSRPFRNWQCFFATFSYLCGRNFLVVRQLSDINKVIHLTQHTVQFVCFDIDRFLC